MIKFSIHGFIICKDKLFIFGGYVEIKFRVDLINPIVKYGDSCATILLNSIKTDKFELHIHSPILLSNNLSWSDLSMLWMWANLAYCRKWIWPLNIGWWVSWIRFGSRGIRRRPRAVIWQDEGVRSRWSSRRTCAPCVGCGRRFATATQCEIQGIDHGGEMIV